MNFATSFGLSLLGLLVLPLPVSGCLPVGAMGRCGTKRVPPQWSCAWVLVSQFGIVRE
jgi:hypothetical protein